MSHYTIEPGGRVRVLQHLWNAPNSAWGLLGGIGGRWQVRPQERVLEVTGGWLVALLAARGWGAITLGDVILYRDPEMRVALRAHEMVHVAQARLWGPLFLPAYGLESAYQWVRGRDPYRGNRFEQQARSTTENK